MQRAKPHALRVPALGLALCLAVASACEEPAPPAPTGPTEEQVAAARARIDELFEALEPVDLTLTSDVHDAALHRRRELMKSLRAGDPVLGREALAVFNARPAEPSQTRVALLEIASHCAPDLARPVLEHLVCHYRSAGMDVRTEAARILAETSPQAAVDLLTPMVVDTRPQQTLPHPEFLLRAWLLASRSLGEPDAQVLADVATNLFQNPTARYVAVDALGEVKGSISRMALEEVLVESGPDGLLRIKAAQAIVKLLPKDEACAVLERVADRETNPVFLETLADFLREHCE